VYSEIFDVTDKWCIFIANKVFSNKLTLMVENVDSGGLKPLALPKDFAHDSNKI